MRLKSFVVAAGLLFSSPAVLASEVCQSLDQLSWILGDWQAENGTESWTRVSENSFEGLGRITNSKGKVTEESLRLVNMSGRIFYIAKVSHNPLPIAFALATCGERQAVFRNPAHDFPKRITYQRKAGNLRVDVAGDDSGFSLQYRKQ